MNTEKPNTKTPKQNFIDRMEELLLMNVLLSGERLPAERDLAKQMGLSRPAIHEGLLELGARGLVSIRPRHGWVVSNFKEEGSLSVLNSLYRFSSSPVTQRIDNNLEELRRIILTTSLKKYFSLPKTHRSTKSTLEYKLFQCIAPSKKGTKKGATDDIQAITEQDFLFYRAIIEAGGNIVFLLLFNSSKELYHKKLESFFARSPEIQIQAVEMKKSLIEAIKSGKQKKALTLIEHMTSYSAYEFSVNSVPTKNKNRS